MTSLSEIQIRDPFVVMDMVTRSYLLHGTTGFGERAHGGFSVRTSTDLEKWSDPQPALAPGAGPVGATHFWAPEVVPYQGRWYLLGTFMHGTEVTHPERRYTRIYVADTPAGPFQPLTTGPITPPGWWSIDGTLHVDGHGTPWLIFVREWLQVNDGEMHAMELTPDLRRSAGAAQRLFRASDAPWSLPQTWDKFSGYRVTDGPWLHRLSSGALLMLWSSFGLAGYLTGVARSVNGEVTGPWVQSPKPLFAADGGHPMLFRTFDGELMMAIHTPNAAGKERAKLLHVRETKDGLELG
ncbi:MAG: glycoside hydrolase family 43 protein [Opitutaceae bacterium]